MHMHMSSVRLTQIAMCIVYIFRTNSSVAEVR